MTRRILAVELRRGIAPALVGALAVFGGMLLFLRPDEWHARWLGLALTFRNDLAVLVPLALAAGVWQAGRARRTGVGELHASTALPRWRAALPEGAAVGIAAVAGGGLLLLIGAALVASGARWISAAPLAVALAGLLALLSAALLGLALGRAVPHLLTAPVTLVVGVIALEYTSTPGTSREILSPVLEPPPFDVLTPVPGFLTGQLLWFAGLAVGAAGLALASTWRARGLAAAPVAGGVALALVLSGGASAQTFRTDARAAAPVCAAGTPRVCVTAVHAAALPTLTGPMRTSLRELQTTFGGAWEAVEAPDPASAVDLLAARRVPFTINGFDLTRGGAVGFRGATPRSFGSSLKSDFATAGADACPYEQPSGRLAAYTFAEELLLDTPGEPVDRQGRPIATPVRREAGAALARLRALTPAERQRTLTAVRRAYIACDPEPLEALR